jgi:predicted metal-dependent RNase
MDVDVDPSIAIGTIPDELINSSIIRFTSISGSRQEMAPNCYLLEIDQCKILLDCGCLYDFDMSHMESLRKIAKSINVIVISHADIKHLGALPYLFNSFGCSCPVLVTVPVHHFGLFVLKDAIESYKNRI